VWDLVLRLGHQLRVSDGRVLGFDFGAAFALAAAMSVPAPAVAEWLRCPLAAVVVVGGGNELTTQKMKYAP
jgi:hypothetical protein